MYSRQRTEKPAGSFSKEPAGETVYSHSANSDIWERILGDFTGKAFANMLIFYLLFGATCFLSIKIVSRKVTKQSRFV